MHETHLIDNILKYFEKEENISSKTIKKGYIRRSKTGGITKGHFLEHFKETTRGTKWESLKIEISEIPYGAELEIVKIDFNRNAEIPGVNTVMPAKKRGEISPRRCRGGNA